MIREPRGAIARALTDAKLKPSQLKALVRPQPRQAEPAATPRRPATRPRRTDRQPTATPRAGTPRRPRRDPEIDDIPEPRAPERPRLTPPPKPAPPRADPRSVVCRSGSLSRGTGVGLVAFQTGGDPSALFVAACLAIVPLASLMSTATEHLAERTGPMLGALLNATFGNATEVIVAIAALNAGYIDLVKASITGSILGNLLLILGLAFLTGGMKQHTLRFSKTAAGMRAAMLALAVAALVLPSLLAGTAGSEHVTELSRVVAVILAVTYLASLLFTLHTHRSVFASTQHAVLGGKPWPLVGAGAGGSPRSRLLWNPSSWSTLSGR